MSLLADLLSKVKFQGTKGDVPPNLKQVVSDSSEKSAARKRFIMLSVLILLAVVSGFGAVYIVEFYMKPHSAKKTSGPPEMPVQEQLAGKPSAVPAPDVQLPPARPETAVAARPKRERSPVSVNKNIFHPARQPEKMQASQAGDYEKKKTSDATASEKDITNQPAGENRESRDAYIYAARAAESKKDYQQALFNYKKALEMDSANYIIMNNISSIMLQTGSYNEAVTYSRKALAINKDYAPSLINLGIACIGLNDNAEGGNYLSRALSVDPSNRHALLNLAILHERLGDFEKAYGLYLQLAEMRDVQGYLGIARISEKKGRKSDAAGYYREILSIADLEPKIRRLANDRLMILEQ